MRRTNDVQRYRQYLRRCIHSRRLDLGLNQTDAAEMAGLARADYASIENGTKITSVERLASIGTRLGLDIHVVCRPVKTPKTDEILNIRKNFPESQNV